MFKQSHREKLKQNKQIQDNKNIYTYPVRQNNFTMAYQFFNKKERKMQKIKQKNNAQIINNIKDFKTPEPAMHLSDDKNQLETKTSQEQYKKIGLELRQIIPEKISFEKMIKMPAYILSSKGNVVNGFMGHASVYFKIPVIQGSYYLEVKKLDDNDEPKVVTYQSSIRVGVCSNNYSVNLPLGGKNSFAWKSVDGKVLHNNGVVEKIQPYGKNDVIGIGMIMYPPYKHPQKGTKFPRGMVCFYKNGKKMSQMIIKEHEQYCMGVSLFNYGRVKIYYEKKDIKYLPQGFQALQSYYKERVCQFRQQKLQK